MPNQYKWKRSKVTGVNTVTITRYKHWLTLDCGHTTMRKSNKAAPSQINCEQCGLFGNPKWYHEPGFNSNVDNCKCMNCYNKPIFRQPEL